MGTSSHAGEYNQPHFSATVSLISRKIGSRQPRPTGNGTKTVQCPVRYGVHTQVNVSTGRVPSSFLPLVWLHRSGSAATCSNTCILSHSNDAITDKLYSKPRCFQGLPAIRKDTSLQVHTRKRSWYQPGNEDMISDRY